MSQPPHRRHRRPHERPGHHTHDPLANVEDWPTFLLAIRENPAGLLGRESVSTLRDVLMGFGLAEIVYDVPQDVLLEGFDLHAFERGTRIGVHLPSSPTSRVIESLTDGETQGRWHDGSPRRSRGPTSAACQQRA